MYDDILADPAELVLDEDELEDGLELEDDDGECMLEKAFCGCDDCDDEDDCDCDCGGDCNDDCDSVAFNPFAIARNIMGNTLLDDEDLMHGYVSNIAMLLKDRHGIPHITANEMAKQIMNLVFTG